MEYPEKILELINFDDFSYHQLIQVSCTYIDMELHERRRMGDNFDYRSNPTKRKACSNNTTIFVEKEQKKSTKINKSVPFASVHTWPPSEMDQNRVAQAPDRLYQGRQPSKSQSYYRHHLCSLPLVQKQRATYKFSGRGDFRNGGDLALDSVNFDLSSNMASVYDNLRKMRRSSYSERFYFPKMMEASTGNDSSAIRNVKKPERQLKRESWNYRLRLKNHFTTKISFSLKEMKEHKSVDPYLRYVKSMSSIPYNTQHNPSPDNSSEYNDDRFIQSVFVCNKPSTWDNGLG